ncbi:MAG TPA: hypothetical protein VFJ91_02320 [Gaiellaceae bacterium]|nr:hypothetical protein [Gaiellaceae bacterium]
MADGLLLTPTQRLRRYGERTALALAAPCVLVVLALADGAPAVAVALAVVAGLLALAIGTSVRTRTGAAVGGVVVAACLYAFNLALAWLGTHPMIPG